MVGPVNQGADPLRHPLLQWPEPAPTPQVKPTAASRMRPLMRASLAKISCLFGVILALPLDLAMPAWSETKPAESRLIPREVLFGNPIVTGVTLSPDGQQIAFLAPHNGVLNLWVQQLQGTAPPRLLTNKTDRPMNPAGWTRDGRHLITTTDTQGDENIVLIKIDANDGGQQFLTPEKGVQAQVVGLDLRNPDEVIVGLNERNARHHDLYILNVKTGEKRLFHEVNNDDIHHVAWLDGQWHLLTRTRIKSDGGREIDLRLPEQPTWSIFLSIDFEDSFTTVGPLGFDASDTWLYGILSDSRGLPTLVRWNRKDLKQCSLNCKYEVIHQALAGTLGAEVSDPKTFEPQVMIETDLKSRRVFLEKSLEKDMIRLQKIAGDREFVVTGQDLDGKKWLLNIVSDTGSPEYWIWDRQKQQGSKLFTVQPALNDYTLAPMESVEIYARDGTRLPSYLTRSTVRREGPQPLVLLVHGGPQSRDHWGYDGEHQFLANRGYHVLSVNFRGSTGFGKQHLLAGEGEWYAKMQDDLIDATQWSIRSGLADPKRIAIMGASYGGYAALAGLTRDPSVFAAAVSVVGPSNLETLLASIPPYWEPARKPLERMLGVGKVDLKDISPLTHVNRIQKPLFIVHGANDPRVNLSESEAIVSSMKAHGLPVEFVVFPDEGHGIGNPRNSLAYYALLEQFLSYHLGGRVEPIGESIQASSLQWRHQSDGEKLVGSLRDQGRQAQDDQNLDSAHGLYLRAYYLSIQSLGNYHPLTIDIQEDLASVESLKGEHQLAIHRLRDVIDKRQQVYGQDQINVLKSQLNRIRALIAAGNPGAARQDLQSLVDRLTIHFNRSPQSLMDELLEIQRHLNAQ